MHLFVASGIFHPESGGPATYLRRLLPELVTRGHEIRVLTFGDAAPLTTEYPYSLKRIPRRRFALRMAHYAQAAVPLVQWSDVVFLNSLGLPVIGDSRRPRAIKIVGDLAWERAVNKGWIAPTEDIDAFQTSRYGTRIELLKQQRAREVQRIQQIIVPSNYLRDMVIGWGAPPENVRVIYNAISPPAHPGHVPQADARQRLDLPPGPLLLAAARLVPWKGIDALIRATAQRPDLTLVIAGDGPDEARLRALAESEGVTARIRFLGRVHRDRMALYFQAADYFALISGYEGLPHVVLESLQAGTPVIASDKGGNPEVVRHDVNGLLVPYGDPDALLAAIDTAFSSGTRDRLAARCGENLARFQWETLVEQTAALLEDLCAF